MAMTGASSNHSPRHSSGDIQSRRPAGPVVSSPWNQIVRGESEPIPAAPSSPPPTAIVEPSSSAATSLPVEDSGSGVANTDNGGGHNGDAARRPAWSKPSNCEASPVMGAVSWPALSESTRSSMKSAPESSKGLLNGSSLLQSQGIGSTPSSSQRQVSDNASANNMVPTRQKSVKHNYSNASSNGGHPLQSALQSSTAGTGHYNSSPRDYTPRSGFTSNDHPQHRNSFRNRNGGPHQRGDGSHHHNYGSRRDQDWNTHRNFNGRNNHMPPGVVPKLLRPPPPPPNSANFIPTSAVAPFGGHIGFPEIAPTVVYVPAPPLDSLGVPFVPPMSPHAVFFPAPDPQLHTKIVKQIDYYFSDENLIKDTYLRQNMDDQGWVPVKLIAGFKKVMHLTDNIQFILDAVRTSSVVEVQADKIRRRNDWRRWIMPPSVHFSNVTGSQTIGNLSRDLLAEQVQSIALETTENDGPGGLHVLHHASQNKPAFGDLNSPQQISTSEGTGQVGFQGSDHSISARK